MNTISTTTVSGTFVKVVEYTGSELKLNSSNLHALLKPYLNEDEDFMVAFVGFLDAEQNEGTSTFITNLVLNITSPQKQKQGSFDSWVTPTAGISLWDKPLKQIKYGKTSLIWFLYISPCSEEWSESDTKLIKLAITMCSRLLHVIPNDEITSLENVVVKTEQERPKRVAVNQKSANIISDILKTDGTFFEKLPNLSKLEHFIIATKFFNNDIKKSPPLEALLGSIEKLKVEETSKARLGAEEGMKLLETPDEETMANLQLAKKVDVETTALEEMPLESFGKEHKQTITLVEARNDEVKFPHRDTADNAEENSNVETAEMEGKNSIHETTEEANTEEWQTEPHHYELMTLATTTNDVKAWADQKTAARDMNTKLKIEVEPTVNEARATAFYDKVMTCMLTERKWYFSTTQIKLIHSTLFKKMSPIFDSSVGGDQTVINRFKETLNERFTLHKQTNIMILKTKVKQLEGIIHQLQTIYSKKLYEIESRGELINENLENKLKQKLTLEIWSKIGQTEPSKVHWESLKSQLRNPKGVYLTEALPSKQEGYLEFQLTYGNLLMGTQKDGQFIKLINEHGQDRTPAVVGLTKANTLVYGTQVSRAEKKDALQKQYHVGKYFEPEGEKFDPNQKYEIFVKNNVRQVGIEFILGFLFKKLKTTAERQLDIQMSTCVIVVPFYFASFQRLQIQYGATSAGFKDVTILSDSSVSAFNFNPVKNHCRNLQILSENNGNLYACIYTFENNQQCGILRESVCVCKASSKTKSDEDYVENLLAELKGSFDKRNIREAQNQVNYENETLSKSILIHWENERWEKIMTSVCCKLIDGGAHVIPVVPLQGAIGMFPNLSEQIPEIPRHSVQSSSKSQCQTDGNRTQFKFIITEEKTHFCQRLFGSLVHPLGTLRVKQFNPSKSYTVTFVGGSNGQVILAKLSKTRGEPPKTYDLTMGPHYIWETPEDSLKAEAPELELLVDYCFARSIEEIKRREGAKQKVSDDEKNKIIEETVRRRRDLVIRCEEMREMMDGNPTQIPDLLKCSLEKVISGAETFAKKASTSLEAINSQASSLNNYYEKYFKSEK